MRGNKTFSALKCDVIESFVIQILFKFNLLIFTFYLSVFLLSTWRDTRQLRESLTR